MSRRSENAMIKALPPSLERIREKVLARQRLTFDEGLFLDSPEVPLNEVGALANLVRERTQGRINIKLYPGVSLIQGDQTREFSAIRQGVIDLAVGSTINWSPQVKELNLFSLPFLMPDYAAMDALTQGDVGKEIFRIVEKAGVQPLAWGENGYREISNSKLAINCAGSGTVPIGVSKSSLVE